MTMSLQNDASERIDSFLEKRVKAAVTETTEEMTNRITSQLLKGATRALRQSEQSRIEGQVQERRESPVAQTHTRQVAVGEATHLPRGQVHQKKRVPKNSRISSSKHLVALTLAFMATFQSPTLASTYQRRSTYIGRHIPDTSSSRDYSSDSYYQQNPLFPFENHSSSQIYFSDDGGDDDDDNYYYQERILSALADADAAVGSSDDTTSDFLPRRRKTRRRKKLKKRRKRQQPNPKELVSQSPLSDSEVESSSQKERTENDSSSSSDLRGSAPSTTGETQTTRNGNFSPTATLGASPDPSREENRPQNRGLGSRLEEMKAKLKEMTEVGNLNQSNDGYIDVDTQPWGMKQVHPGSSQFAPKNDAFNAQGSSKSESLDVNHPSYKKVIGNTISTAAPPSQHRLSSKGASHPPPASKMGPHQQSTPSIGRRQPLQNGPKPKPRGARNPASATRDTSVSPWVRKFHSTRPKDCLVLVPRDFIADNFNLARLAPVVEHLAAQKQEELEASSSPNLEQRGKVNSARIQQQQNHNPPKHSYPIYRQALDLILRQHQSNPKENEPSKVIQFAAEVLYTLIHARYVVSPRGLETVRSRLIAHGSKSIHQPLFGRCPRLGCQGMPLLPCGLSDDFDSDSVSHHVSNSKAKRYCCNCHETIHCWESKVDGSAWGTSVCHLLLMIFGEGELFPSHFATPYRKTPQVNSKGLFGIRAMEQDFGPNCGSIFGFPIHPTLSEP